MSWKNHRVLSFSQFLTNIMATFSRVRTFPECTWQIFLIFQPKLSILVKYFANTNNCNLKLKLKLKQGNILFQLKVILKFKFNYTYVRDIFSIWQLIDKTPLQDIEKILLSRSILTDVKIYELKTKLIPKYIDSFYIFDLFRICPLNSIFKCFLWLIYLNNFFFQDWAILMD